MSVLPSLDDFLVKLEEENDIDQTTSNTATVTPLASLKINRQTNH